MMAVQIQDLDVYGRGVARVDGQVIFIEGALPNEWVDYSIIKKQKRFIEAKVETIYERSPNRVIPDCEYYSQCGGCVLQHLDFSAQVQAKERLYTQQLQKIGQIVPRERLPTIAGQAWHYRARTRLAVQYEQQKISLGYRARASHQVVNIHHCLVLDKRLSNRISSVHELLQRLLPKRVKAVSLHSGESTCALCLETDEQLPLMVLQTWQSAQRETWTVWVNQRCVIGDAQALFYELPDYQVNIPFTPQDFTQVNPQVNRALVAQAIQWAVQAEVSEAMDFFAGLGNFSLPMATQGMNVEAVEGVWEMVERLALSAKTHQLDNKITAKRADLFAPNPKALKRWQQQALWLLDPPRAGAAQLLSAMNKNQVRHIIYVSCDSATLARDAKILTEKGFVADKLRVANMFAQTAHIEGIVYFTREQ